MGVKFRLQKQANALIDKSRYGAMATRREDARIWLASIETLASLKYLPNHVTDWSASHFERLVQYWQDSDITQSSVMQYLAALRRINRQHHLQWIIPSNNELNLKPKPRRIIKYDVQCLSAFHPITQSMIELQRHFGLTRKESAAIHPLEAKTGTPTVAAEIAHNHKDRYIPITTSKQKKILQVQRKLVASSPLFRANSDNHLTVLALYKAECLHLGISPQTEFRMAYLHSRLASLLTLFDKIDAWRTLAEEMGYARVDKFMRKWHESDQA